MFLPPCFFRAVLLEFLSTFIIQGHASSDLLSNHSDLYKASPDVSGTQLELYAAYVSLCFQKKR